MRSYTIRRILKKLQPRAELSAPPLPPQPRLQIYPERKIILANRVDGFGERLCAIINAIRLADHLDADFRFSWSDKIWSDVYVTLDANRPAQVLGQSIAPQAEIFSQKFIVNHAMKHWSTNTFVPVPAYNVTQEALTTSGRLGWFTTQHHLSTDYGPQVANDCKISSANAFERIEFSDQLMQAVEKARALDLGDFLALHLRSGDMVYGEVRKWGFWGNKIINPVVAVDIIKHSHAKGQKIIVFGQDIIWFQHLRSTYGVVIADDLVPADVNQPHVRALFEMVVMAQANEIIAGDSGFARAASMISNRPVKSMFDAYSPIRYSDVTIAGMSAAEPTMHPLMVAYSFWQAYAFGRSLRSVPQLIDIISKAHSFDPDNHLHLIIMAALKYRMGEDAAAEALLGKSYEQAGIAWQSVDHPINKQVIFRYFTPKYTHEEQFADFIAAARRPGNPYAQHIAQLIKSNTL